MEIRILIVLALLCISNSLFSMRKDKEKLENQKTSTIAEKKSNFNPYLSQVIQIPAIHNIISDYLKQWVEVKRFLSGAYDRNRKLLYLSKHLTIFTGNGEISLFHTDNYDLIHKIPMPEIIGMTSVAHLLSNKCVALGAMGNIVILDAEMNKFSFKGHDKAIHALEFSPCGKYLASGSYDNTLKIWDANTFKLVNTLNEKNFVDTIAYSPNNKHLASNCGSEIKIWDARTYKLLRALDDHSITVNTLTYSSNGKWLASGDHYGVIRIWDADTFKLLATIFGHADYITLLKYSPDNKYLASASRGCIKIHDANTYKLLYQLDGQKNLNNPYANNDYWDVSSMIFFPDNKHLASCYSDGTIKIWHYEGIEHVSDSNEINREKNEDILSSTKEEAPKCIFCEYEEAKIKCTRCQQMLYCSRACKDTGMHSHLDNCKGGTQ